jgi:electron transport complex protein RnfG
MSAANGTAGTVSAARPLPVLEQPQVPSWRLLLTLGGAGALAGLLIVLTYQATLPRIEQHRAGVLKAAISEVLKDPARADTFWLHGGALVATLPAGVDGAKLERVYRGYDAQGRTVGWAITGGAAGFADQVGVIFGYDATSRQLLAMKVLSTKETPGLGDRIEKPAFTAQFGGRELPLEGVKSGPPADAHDLVMVTGATISSRTVIRAINDAVARWQPLIDAQAKSATAAVAGRP